MSKLRHIKIRNRNSTRNLYEVCLANNIKPLKALHYLYGPRTSKFLSKEIEELYITKRDYLSIDFPVWLLKEIINEKIILDENENEEYLIENNNEPEGIFVRKISKRGIRKYIIKNVSVFEWPSKKSLTYSEIEEIVKDRSKRSSRIAELRLINNEYVIWLITKSYGRPLINLGSSDLVRFDPDEDHKSRHRRRKNEALKYAKIIEKVFNSYNLLLNIKDEIWIIFNNNTNKTFCKWNCSSGILIFDGIYEHFKCLDVIHLKNKVLKVLNNPTKYNYIAEDEIKTNLTKVAISGCILCDQ